jgi:predicted permease
MGIAIKVIYNVALLFIMMIPGILLKKCKLSTDGIGKGISNLVLYIAQPALIFLAYLRPFDKEILINSAYVLALSVVVHIIFSVVAMNCFRKSPDSARRMLRFATIFSNAAFMGIPLISAVLEETYPGATVYASIYNITFNLFLWSLGVYICTDKRDVNQNGVEDDVEHIKNSASHLKAL